MIDAPADAWPAQPDPKAPRDLAQGRTVGNYKIGGVIARGGLEGAVQPGPPFSFIVGGIWGDAAAMWMAAADASAVSKASVLLSGRVIDSALCGPADALKAAAPGIGPAVAAVVRRWARRTAQQPSSSPCPKTGTPCYSRHPATAGWSICWIARPPPTGPMPLPPEGWKIWAAGALKDKGDAIYRVILPPYSGEGPLRIDLVEYRQAPAG